MAPALLGGIDSRSFARPIFRAQATIEYEAAKMQRGGSEITETDEEDKMMSL